MVAARLGCKRDIWWATSRPGCMNNSTLTVGSFLAGKAVWAMSGWLPTDSADYCILINEWAWPRSCVCLLRLKVHLGAGLSQGSHKI